MITDHFLFSSIQLIVVAADSFCYLFFLSVLSLLSVLTFLSLHSVTFLFFLSFLFYFPFYSLSSLCFSCSIPVTFIRKRARTRTTTLQFTNLLKIKFIVLLSLGFNVLPLFFSSVTSSSPFVSSHLISSYPLFSISTAYHLFSLQSCLASSIFLHH